MAAKMLYTSAGYGQVGVSLQIDCLGKFFHDFTGADLARSSNTGHESPNELSSNRTQAALERRFAKT
jgi:hypothetical protein